MLLCINFIRTEVDHGIVSNLFSAKNNSIIYV